MKRQHQIALIVSTLAFSWLMMQAVHELGHVMAALASGGRVAGVILHPAAISFTRFSVNPRPLFVAAMGPIAGVLLPLGASVVACWRQRRAWYLIQFFAGFCLIANGAYIAFGTIDHIGDAGDLVRHGAPVWLLWLFGVITIPLGLWLWHGLGPYFGIGPNAKEIDRPTTYLVIGLLAGLVILEVLLSSHRI